MARDKNMAAKRLNRSPWKGLNVRRILTVEEIYAKGLSQEVLRFPYDPHGSTL